MGLVSVSSHFRIAEVHVATNVPSCWPSSRVGRCDIHASFGWRRDRLAFALLPGVTEPKTLSCWDHGFVRREIFAHDGSTESPRRHEALFVRVQGDRFPEDHLLQGRFGGSLKPGHPTGVARVAHIADCLGRWGRMPPNAKPRPAISEQEGGWLNLANDVVQPVGEEVFSRAGWVVAVDALASHGTRMGVRCHRSRNRLPEKASPRRPRSRAWRSLSPNVTRCSTSWARQSGSGPLPNHGPEESPGHPKASSVPVVVAERVLVQVGLKVLGRDGVVCPADTSTSRGPETFDGVGVGISAHIDALRVVDPPVGV